MLIIVRNGALTPRDVKNEGTSGDVYENKGGGDKMSRYRAGFLQKMQGFLGNQGETRAFVQGIAASPSADVICNGIPFEKMVIPIGCGWRIHRVLCDVRDRTYLCANI